MKILSVDNVVGNFNVGDVITNIKGITSIAISVNDDTISITDPINGQYEDGDNIVGIPSNAVATISSSRDSSLLDISQFFGSSLDFNLSDFFENLPTDDLIEISDITLCPDLSSTSSLDGNSTAFLPNDKTTTSPVDPSKQIPAQPKNNPHIPIGNEPTKEYTSQNPYNKVNNTEGGHLIEIDDTPGNERILTKHVSGTYDEMHTDGDKVSKIVKDNYTIVAGDDYITIEGKATIHINGDCSLRIGSALNVIADGGINYVTKGAFRLKADSINMETVSGDFNLLSAKDINVTAKDTNNIKSKNIIIDSDVGTYINSTETIHLSSNDNIINSKSSIGLISSGDINMKSNSTKMSASSVEVDADLNVKNTTNMKSSGNPVIGSGASSATVTDAISKSAITSTGSGISYVGDPDKIFEMTDDNEQVAAKLIKQGLADGSINKEDFNKQTTEGRTDFTSAVATSGTLKTHTVENLGNSSPNDNMRLTQHFTAGKLSKFTPVCSHIITAQHGLSTTDITGNLQLLAANCLELILAKYPDMTVTNAFRIAASSDSSSQHEKGQAADLQFNFANKDNSLYFDIAEWIKQNVPFDQLLLEYKTTGTKLPWIHISYKQSGNRQQVMTMKNGTVYKQGLVELKF